MYPCATRSSNRCSPLLCVLLAEHTRAVFPKTGRAVFAASLSFGHFVVCVSAVRAHRPRFRPTSGALPRDSLTSRPGSHRVFVGDRRWRGTRCLFYAILARVRVDPRRLDPWLLGGCFRPAFHLLLSLAP